MYKKNFLAIIVLFFSINLFVPAFSLAAGENEIPSTVVSLENPLKDNLTDVRQIYGRALKIVLGILGSLALFVFIDGAWNWMTSIGNAEKVKKGSSAMVWAVIGIFAIFASYGILNALINVGLKARTDLGSYDRGTSGSTATSTADGTGEAESGGTNITGVCAIKYAAICSSKKKEQDCNVATVIKGTSIQPCIFDKLGRTCDPKPDLGCGGLTQEKCVDPCEFQAGSCLVKGGSPNCYVAGQGKTKEDVIAECNKKPNCDWFE